MEHHFNIDEAVKYGVEKAVLLYNIRFWLEKNKANQTNIKEKDGVSYYWTFNSASAFADLFPYMAVSSIQRWLTELERAGILIVGSFNKRRADRTKWYTMPEYATQNEKSIAQNELTITQNEPALPDNKQHIVNTYKTNSSVEEKNVIVTPGQLPTSRGKTYIIRVLSVYRDLFFDKYRFYPTVSVPRFGKSLKQLIETKTELQIAAMLITFFNWHGMTGQEQFEHEKLLKAAFNVNWFFSTVTQYEAYLRNVMRIDFDSNEDVLRFVSSHMKSLSTVPALLKS